MNHQLIYSITIKPMFVLLNLSLFALLIPVVSMAQAGSDFESKPTAETEIICYAAQKKWVCAPADQKQQANDKAMKLVESQPLEIDGNTADSGQVEIKTMDLNNDSSQQAQEGTPENQSQLNVIDQQTEVFLPRDNTDRTEVDIEPTNAAEVVVETTQESVDADKSDTDLTSAVNEWVNQPTHVANSLNDFEYWQNNHTENWSFQVIGTSNRHHLESFIEINDLAQNNYTIVKTQVNSADWWVVLVGLYDSRDQALSQRGQLPAELAGQAWVRQIKSIDGQAD